MRQMKLFLFHHLWSLKKIISKKGELISKDC